MEEEKDLHPEVEKILNFVIPKEKIRKELQMEEKDISVGDLIDSKTDIRFDQKTGKPMMMHSGILAIWDGIGAELLEPKLEKTGDAEYQVVQGIRFANGSVFYATGEASKLNTDDRELSGKFPVNQAHVRALNKAIVRGLGLYRVLLTEEEADEFKNPLVQKMRQEFEAKLKEVVQKNKAKEDRMTKVIDGMMEIVALPEDDPKYPKAYIFDIKEDLDYLEELRKSENKIIGFVASRYIKQAQALMKEKELEEERLANEQLVNQEESDIDGKSVE